MALGVLQAAIDIDNRIPHRQGSNFSIGSSMSDIRISSRTSNSSILSTETFALRRSQ